LLSVKIGQHECKKCGVVFNSQKYIWDEHGTGYSTKLVKCPQCSGLVVVKEFEDFCLDVNNDPRFYEY
jgi:uncharacterized C2H2 Zn-finger protein